MHRVENACVQRPNEIKQICPVKQNWELASLTQEGNNV
jgi:hypothetical protein